MGKFTNFVMDQGGAQLTADQAAAAAAADKAVTFGGTTVTPEPVKALQERTPQAAPVLQGVAGARAQAEAGAIPVQTDVGGELGSRPQTPEEAEAAYRGQIESEKVNRSALDLENGIVTLPLNAKNKNVGTVANNIARVEHAFNADTGAFTTGGVTKNMGIAGLAKLGLTQDKTPGSPLKRAAPGAGGAVYLAALMALQKAASQAEVYQGEGVVRGSSPRSEINKIQLADSIADNLEQLVRQSPTVSPEGEAEARGYESSLSPEERTALGELAFRMLGQSGVFNESKEAPGKDAIITRTGGGGLSGVEMFSLTPAGYTFLQDMSNVLEEVSPSLSRPVSYTPLPEGQYRGEAATKQTELTRVPDPNASVLTPTILKAMDVIGTTPNAISVHKMEMTDIMLQDIQAKEQALDDAARQEVNYDQTMEALKEQEGGRPQKDWGQASLDFAKQVRAEYRKAKVRLAADPQFTSPFARLFDLGFKQELEIAEGSKKASTFFMKVRWDEDQNLWVTNNGKPVVGENRATGVTDQQKLNEQYPDKNGGDFVEFKVERAKRQEDQLFHNQFASNVIKQATQKAMRTLEQARAASGKTFFYGATAIGNSSRLMYTQTELNPQANKLARFMVDNPVPSVVPISNGKPSKAFQYVVARAMLDAADTFTPAALVQRFNSKDVQEAISPVARAVYNAMQLPADQRTPALAAAMQQAYDNHFLADEWEGTGEWGFVLDALHEYGKFLNARDNGATQFATRVKAEADGINNGSSIQGLQFGDRSILERAGVIFDQNGESVIPQGNLRDMVVNSLFNEEGDVTSDALQDVNPNLAPVIADLLPTIQSNSAMRKKFIKVPLMTTIYGKGSKGHKDSAQAFVAKYGSDLGITDENRAAVVDGFTQVIHNALVAALNDPLVHQNLVKKQAGWFFNMMNVVPEVEGPNGFIIQSGGVDYVVPEGSAGNIQTKIFPLDEEGQRTTEKPKPVKTTFKVPVPSATARKKAEGGREAAWGEMTRNQLAVNGTHNIDATVAQETLIAAKQKMGNNFWGHQIFDAFMGDVGSFEKIIDIANEKFLSVNRRYNMISAEYDAFKKAINQFKTEMDLLDPESQLDISDEGRYRGVKAFIEEHISKDNRWLHGGDNFRQFLSSIGIEVEKPPKGKAYKVKTDKVSPDALKKLVNYARAEFLSTADVVVDESTNRLAEGSMAGVPVDQAFKSNIKRTDAAKEEFFQEYKDQLAGVRQFN